MLFLGVFSPPNVSACDAAITSAVQINDKTSAGMLGIYEMRMEGGGG